MLSVLVPVYNNAATVSELAARLDQSMRGEEYEIVFVDDGSADGSIDVLRGLAAADPRVKVIALSRNFGQHPAISAALEHARGDRFVLMDADLQDRPEDVPALLAPLADGLDVVYTIKRDTDPAGQRLSSAFYHYVFSRLVKVQVPRNIGTFRAFNRRMRDALLQFPERNVLYGPLMFYIGLRSTFVEVLHESRPAQRSGYTFGKRLALAIGSLVSYTDLPHRVFLLLGVGLVAASVVYGTATVVGYVWFGRTLPEGLNLIVLLLVVMLGSLMASLGIVGAYLFRVYEEVLGRPRYIVAERINVAGSSAERTQ